MNCAEAEELLGAWALDALPGGEAAAFRAHIAGCGEHAQKAAELRAVAARLPALTEPLPPPPALRGRILDAVAAEGAPPRSIESRRPRARIQRSPRTRLSMPLPAFGALAAAVVLALGGLLAWNVTLRAGDGDDLARLAARASAVRTLEAHGVSGGGAVLYFEDERKAVVVAQGLDPLDADRTYQMWAIEDGAPRSIGLMRPGEAGNGAAVVDYDAARASVFAITIEPAGGSPQPTSDPVFTAEL